MVELPWVENHADERRTLEQFVDFFRAVAARKLIGLTPEQANRRAIEPTTMTIAGIVKHLAFVEDSWFQKTLHGRELPEPWKSAPFAADRDWDFNSAGDDSPESLVELYASACERSRAAIEGVSLDTITAPDASGEQFSLRWILVHMVDETARHAGHLDLLREAIDGATGD